MIKKQRFTKSAIKKAELDNLTLITNSYACNKGCPFCIAKNNKLFYQHNDEFDKLYGILDNLNNNNLKFKRFVLSGNGEPSFYSYEDIATIALAVKSNSEMFDKVRVQTSGNLFYENKKLRLLENLHGKKTEMMIHRLSLDNTKDMSLLGYKNDYTKTDSFKNAENIMFDIALTKHLEVDNFAESLEHLLVKNPNILTIRFKTLMAGKNDKSPQALWVNQNTMNKNEIFRFINMLKNRYEQKNSAFSIGKTKLLFEESGAYNKDIVLSSGKIMNYDLKILNIDDMIQISKQTCKSDSLLK